MSGDQRVWIDSPGGPMSWSPEKRAITEPGPDSDDWAVVITEEELRQLGFVRTEEK